MCQDEGAWGENNQTVTRDVMLVVFVNQVGSRFGAGAWSGDTLCCAGVERNAWKKPRCECFRRDFCAAIRLLSQLEPILNPKAPTSSSSKDTNWSPSRRADLETEPLRDGSSRIETSFSSSVAERRWSVRHGRVKPRLPLNPQKSLWRVLDRSMILECDTTAAPRGAGQMSLFTLRYVTIVGKLTNPRIWSSLQKSSCNVLGAHWVEKLRGDVARFHFVKWKLTRTAMDFFSGWRCLLFASLTLRSHLSSRGCRGVKTVVFHKKWKTLFSQ